LEPFLEHEGIVVPLDRISVDTDAIMPKEFIKRIERTGFGQFLFYYWRFDENGEPRPDFILNREPYRSGTILLARKNFGCGSSREHAPWGLQDYGFKVLIAPSFGDIFYNNCLKIGLLPVVLAEEEVDRLFRMAAEKPGMRLKVDLQNTVIRGEEGVEIPFGMDPFRREQLMLGLDDIGLTHRYEDRIREFERSHKIYYRLN